MCLSPIFIRVRKSYDKNRVPVHDYREFVANNENLNRKFRNNPLQYADTYVELDNFHGVFVPCGKCLECMKRRADAHAFKLYKHIEHCPRLYHITLTYSPDTIPFAVHMDVLDKDTGEVVPLFSTKIIDNVDYLCELREWYNNIVPGREPCYKYDVAFSTDDIEYLRIVTPSLNRQDVRLLLKQVRVEYKRKYGVNADFVYSFCGEYGPQTNRPHYHIVLASDSDISKFVAMFNASWRKKFGFTVLRHIKRFNDDKSDAFAIVSRYISKYISKGEYENPAALAGFCERGRVCQSCFMAKKDETGVSRIDKYIDSIRDYHLCYNIFGEYDPDTLRFPSGKRLSQEQLDTICLEMRERLHVNFGYSSVAMPRFIKDRIFGYKDSEGKIKHYAVFQFLADSIQSFYFERESEQFARTFRQKNGDTNLVVSFLNRTQEGFAEHRKKRLKENYERFLSKSYSNF